MKTATIAAIIALVGCISSNAAHVGCLYFGAVSSGSDAKGEYRGILGHVELPKDIAPETIQIELISEGRTIAVWYATKGQEKVVLKFNLPITTAKQSRLVLRQQLPKGHPDGTSSVLEEIDLAKDVFFLSPKTKKPNKTQQGKPR